MSLFCILLNIFKFLSDILCAQLAIENTTAFLLQAVHIKYHTYCNKNAVVFY